MSVTSNINRKVFGILVSENSLVSDKDVEWKSNRTQLNIIETYFHNFANSFISFYMLLPVNITKQFKVVHDNRIIFSRHKNITKLTFNKTEVMQR